MADFRNTGPNWGSLHAELEADRKKRQGGMGTFILCLLFFGLGGAALGAFGGAAAVLRARSRSNPADASLWSADPSEYMLWAVIGGIIGLISGVSFVIQFWKPPSR